MIFIESAPSAIYYPECCPKCGWSIRLILANGLRRCCHCANEWPKPIPKVIACPHCGAPHIDRDEWAVKPHRSHLCLSCHQVFEPFDYYTVGVHEKDLPK